jgi:hypothetical protein
MIRLDEGIARVVYAATCEWNNYLGDPGPDMRWDILPGWQKEMQIRLVQMIREGYGPESVHGQWADVMEENGWVPGDTRDACASPPTHPGLREWCHLLPGQKRRYTMAIAIVRNLAG